jgi:putative pyruvate formate lyase activating enzyme
VDRAVGELGYCHTGAGFLVALICRHRGEEPVLGGEKGICNVFFSHCNLHCVYCQNWQISANSEESLGHELAFEEVLARVGSILDEGVSHVGFVSPSHVIPRMVSLIEALSRRTPKPVMVMNTNAYDRVETLRGLEGLIDVYLPDLKYMDSELAGRLSDAEDYPEVASRALREMYRQKGSRLWLDEEGMATSGLIVRHLVLPGQVENSKRCLQFIAEELSPSVHLSLLAQYRPTPNVARDPLLGRRVTQEEYEAVIEEMERLGFHNGWTQELDSAENYNPDFRERHPFETDG